MIHIKHFETKSDSALTTLIWFTIWLSVPADAAKKKMP